MNLPPRILLIFLGAVALHGTSFADDNAARLLLQAGNGELEGIKSSDGSKMPSASQWVKDPEKAKRTVAVIQPLTADGWTTFSITFKATEATSVKLRISGDFNKAGETWALFDNVKAEGAEIVNGDFETSAQGVPSGWMLQKTEGKQGELLTDGKAAASGEKYIKVSHTYPAVQMIQVPANQEVTITASARLAP
ncbi:hypothetical protein BH09VER1_BH09VER1_07540 [soil metagenome]